MAEVGSNRGSNVVADIQQGQGASQEIQHGGPEFDVPQRAQEGGGEAPSEPGGGGSHVGEIVDNATSGYTGGTTQARQTEPEQVHRMSAVASTVENAMRGTTIPQQQGRPEQRQQASVPIVPQDTGLMPGLGGRVQAEQASGGYAPQSSSGQRLQSVNLEGAVYQAPQNQQAQVRQQARQEVQQEISNAEVREESIAQTQQDSKQRYEEDQSRDIVRELGSFEKPPKLNVLSRANRRFKESRKFIQEKIKTRLKGAAYHGSHGNAFSDTIFSLSTLMPDQVSVGSDNIMEALRDPNSNIIEIINKANPMANLDRESCLADIELLINAVNTSNIEVVFEKYPVNTRHSIQVRTLHVHRGRGIGLHPTQTKAYNADFDGDTGNVNLDQTNLKNYSRAMTHLIDSEGNPTIDSDFFPLDAMAMTDSKDRSDLLKSMQERNFAWDPSVATRLVDAYIAACNDGDWVGLLRKMDEVAGSKELQERTGLYRNQLVSRILKSTYDYAIDRRGLNLKLEWANVIDSYEYTEPDPDAHPIVYDLIDMVDAIAQGCPAMNFQDFTTFFNKQYGDLGGKSVNGKNVPFRLLADFAKAIHRNDLITVGDATWGIDAKGNANENSYVTMYDLWQFTCSAGVSKLISGRVHMGSHELAVSTFIKTRLFQVVPVPNYWRAGMQDNNGNVIDDETAARWNEEIFRDWIKRFQREYNSHMRMLNVSQVRMRGGMRINRREKLFKYDGFNDINDCAKALVEVYGDLTVERVFPNSFALNSYGERYNSKRAGNRENLKDGVINRYANMTLAEFAVRNRLDWRNEGATKDDKGIAKKDAIKGRIDRGQFTPYDILMLVADRRSKQFGDYNKSWLEATEKHVDIMRRIRDDMENDDFNEYANDMLEFVHLMSPRMFDHFGMDSPITFAKSKWGKRLLACNKVGEFRSVLVSMTVEYRFSRASNLAKKVDELKNETVPKENQADLIADADAHYVQELRSLASSSMAWESIVSEALGDTHAFRVLLRDKKIKRGREEDWDLKAADFWKNNSTETQYSLSNFLKSSADYETKINVLCDVVRVNTGIKSINPNDIIGMLAHNPDPLFAGSRFEMDSGISSATKAVKDSIDKITSYKSRSPHKIKKMADKVLEQAYEDKAAFERKLYRFATEPEYYTHVDTIFAADAISSIYEKAYSDSEKIKQQTLVNGYFECVTLQRSGGFYTHLQQTDNSVVNVVGFDQLTTLDIVRILGDPNIELHGYDEFGTPCVYSRESLCGGNSIDDVLRYMHEHPRIACAMRRQIVGINDDVDGTARLSVLDDDRAGVSLSNNVFSLLNDRPRFLAIAALITPAKNNVGRNLAEHVNDNIRNLCLFVMDEAASGKNAVQITRDIEKTFGITSKRFMDLRMEGAFDPDDISDLDREAVANLYSQVVEELLDCVNLIQNSNLPIKPVPKSAFNMDSIAIDKSSMLAYYDARQQLNGARTAKMIGIEGSETKKNLVLKEYVRNRPDRFMTVTADMGRAAILRLSELTQSDIRQQLEDSEDGMLVIEVPAGWSVEDLTLEHNPGNQVGSISKFLEVKREKGAETFNAKSKKFGDDGSNSIIKFFKYGTRAMFSRYGKLNDKVWTVEQGADLRAAIENAGSKDEAIPLLADALMKADLRLGYIDTDDAFQKSDYWNRADLMLVEYQDENGETKIAIRTLEQLAVAFRNRLSDEAVLSRSADTVLAELTQLEQVVGTPADPMYNPSSVSKTALDSVRVTSGVGSVARFDRALRPYSSSTERNFELVWRLFKEFGANEKDEEGNTDVVYRMPSRDEINEHTNKMFAQLHDEKLAKALKGVAYPNDKWNSETREYELNPYGDRRNVYDYLGRPQDEGFKLIPGPQSLVYFDGTNHDDAQWIEKCKKYGITAAFGSYNTVPSKYKEDAITLEDGIVILPFFDMRLNGAASEPISPAPGQFPYQTNNAVVSVEDTTFEIKPGDASGHITNDGLDKTHINFRGTESFNAFDLFPNVLLEKVKTDEGKTVAKNQFIDEEFRLELPRLSDIQKILEDATTVDYGVLEGTPGFERERERYYIRLEEYADKFLTGAVDEHGFVTDEDCGYDSIVGFAKIRIGAHRVAFAPIVPFHLEQSGKAPSKFQMSAPVIDNDAASYSMQWKFTGDIRNQYIKFFEGIGASNKLMIYGDPIRSRSLANGLPVDMMYSTSSVSSRLFPVNKRIHTMITMLMIPRLDVNYSYNFGELPGTNPKIAGAIKAGTMTLQDWTDFVRDNPDFQYHTDPEINSVVKWLVEKCVAPGTGYQTVNPNILLSTHTVTEAGERVISQPIGTEFEAFMDSGYNFQNSLMKLMHAMCPTLVPANIDDDSSSTLMKPVNKGRNDNDYGVLQMMVPHWTTEEGKYYEVAENVYISFGFFGDEFSGFKKTNFDASNRGLDDLNVSNNLDGFDLSQVMMFGRAGYSNIPSMNMMEVAEDNIMQEIVYNMPKEKTSQ